MPQVLLLGASGGMGRRIAGLWRADVPGVPLRLGVRRPESLETATAGEEVVVARLDDPASLRAALAGATVAINAIGPYVYDPGPLLDACAEAGAHYVDLASEPEFLAAVRGRSHLAAGAVAVCPGASTVPGTIELAARHLAARLADGPAAFDVFLSMGSANRLTPGLLGSLTSQLGVPLRSPEGGRSYRRLRSRRLMGLDRRSFGRYPSPFDAAGLALPEGSVPARFWVGLDRGWIVHALRGVSYLRPRFRESTWMALSEKIRPLVGLANRLGGFAGGLRIEALDAAGEVLGAVNFLARREGLNIPALPAVWAAQSLVRQPQPGFQPLYALVTFDEAAASLRQHGFEVSVELPA